ncbi:MAG: hypothetical protein ACLQVG_20845 [Terriglobia bacterium]
MTFPYVRGNIVQFAPAPTAASRPHIEDQNTQGLSSEGRGLTEVELVDFLRRAEMSADLKGLFEGELSNDSSGGNAWVASDSATRSICGCLYKNIRFRVFEDSEDVRIRARLVLPSGETLGSLPVVDQQWRNFLYDFLKGPAVRALSGFEDFLNQSIRPKLMQSPQSFARIGITRAKPNDRKCWLMLDSLFPQPSTAWLSNP